METTHYEDILREACEEVDLDAQNLGTPEFLTMRRLIQQRLEKAWRYHFWPDLQRIEQRWYRPWWNAATAYGATVEVFWPLDGNYYVSLQPVPAGTQPTDNLGNVNLSYWAQTAQYALQPDLTNQYQISSANVYAWNPTQTYTQGQRVQFMGVVYQLFTASATGVLPTDATNWGVIPLFNAYVAYEQNWTAANGVAWTPFTIVEGAWSSDPRVTTRGNELNWWLSNLGVQIATPINWCWLQYRLRCPWFNTGGFWRSDVAYAAGAVVYYSDSQTTGDFYTVVGGTTAGDTPVSQPGEFAVIAIPRMFHNYLVLGASADYAKDLKSAELAQTALLNKQDAQTELEDVKSLYVGQMSQRVKTVVVTR